MSGEKDMKLSDAGNAGYSEKDELKEENRKYCIRSGYILREIAGDYTIIPVDEESEFTNSIMVPNDSAIFLWKAFEKPSTIEEVVRKGLEEYEVTEEIIRNSTERFIAECLKHGILEEVE